MRNIYTYLCGAKNTHCEDALFACERFAFVIDGATGVDGCKVTDAFTDAEWYARTFRDTLAGLLKKDASLLSIMRECVCKTVETYDSFLGASQVKDKPSAMISAVRERGGMLEYYCLGDAGIVLRDREGGVRYLLDERLVKLDEALLLQMKKIAREEGLPFLETFPRIVPQILQNRARMNKAGGYGALAHTVEGLDTAVMGSVPIAGLKDVLLFSDGFAEAYDLFGLYKSPAEMIADIAENGIVQAVKKLHAAQNSDPACENFSRLKFRDDMSVVYARF